MNIQILREYSQLLPDDLIITKSDINLTPTLSRIDVVGANYLLYTTPAPLSVTRSITGIKELRDQMVFRRTQTGADILAGESKYSELTLKVSSTAPTH